jgi:hypothetical protein
MNMRQEDYLLKQIDQLGQVLARLIGSILGLKNQGKETEIVSLVDKTLKNELDIDLSRLISIPKGRLIETIKQNKEISNENLDRLADILTEIANVEQNKVIQNLYFEHILEIYKYVEKNDKTYSLERYQKMERIKNEISI